MIESGDSMWMKMIYKAILNHVGVVKVFTSFINEFEVDS